MIIGRILALFGYVRVPKEVIQLSRHIEQKIEDIYNRVVTEQSREYFSGILKGQQALTKFLISGRYLNKDK